MDDSSCFCLSSSFSLKHAPLVFTYITLRPSECAQWIFFPLSHEGSFFFFFKHFIYFSPQKNVLQEEKNTKMYIFSLNIIVNYILIINILTHM